MWSSRWQRSSIRGCAVLNIPELATDKRFASNQQRVIHRDTLVVDLNRAASDWHKAGLEQALRDVGTPAGVVRALDEVFEDSDHRWKVQNPSGARRTRAVAYRVQYLS